MKPKYIERLLGKYCKIISKSPGKKKGVVLIGRIDDIDILENTVRIELEEGSDIVQVENIIAIRSL